MKFLHLKKVVAAVLVLFSFGSLHAQTNQQLINQLKSIKETDQKYRGAPVNEAGKKFGWNSPQVKELMHKQDELDRANLAVIEKIIAQYGYPGKTLVGEEYQSVAFLVVQHNDNDVQEKYLPLFTQAANKGELRWSSLALMIDRVRTSHNQPQLYGTQMLEKDNKRLLFPIEDEPNVNVRRAKIGLPQLEAYLKPWGIVYRVPTVESNPNPPELYVDQKKREESPVELIGGYPALYAKLNYPEEAKASQITGKVTVELTVDKNGMPKNVQVIKGLGYGCDEEALNVMKNARFTNTTGDDYDIRVNLPFPYQKN